MTASIRFFFAFQQSFFFYLFIQIVFLSCLFLLNFLSFLHFPCFLIFLFYTFPIPYFYHSLRVGRNPYFSCFYHPLFFSDKSCFFASQNLFFWEGTFPHTFFSNKSCFSASKSFFYQTNFFVAYVQTKSIFFHTLE